MSFKVRKAPKSLAKKASTHVVSKRKVARAVWDDTINNLDVHRATPEDIKLRKESHRSKHMGMPRNRRDGSVVGEYMGEGVFDSSVLLDETSLRVAGSVLNETDSLNKTLEKSDSLMAQAAELETRRYQAFANITTAPGTANYGSYTVLNEQQSISPSKLDSLSKSVLNDRPLNEQMISVPKEEGANITEQLSDVSAQNHSASGHEVDSVLQDIDKLLLSLRLSEHVPLTLPEHESQQPVSKDDCILKLSKVILRLVSSIYKDKEAMAKERSLREALTIQVAHLQLSVDALTLDLQRSVMEAPQPERNNLDDKHVAGSYKPHILPAVMLSAPTQGNSESSLQPEIHNKIMNASGQVANNKNTNEQITSCKHTPISPPRSPSSSQPYHVSVPCPIPLIHGVSDSQIRKVPLEGRKKDDRVKNLPTTSTVSDPQHPKSTQSGGVEQNKVPDGKMYEAEADEINRQIMLLNQQHEEAQRKLHELVIQQRDLQAAVPNENAELVGQNMQERAAAVPATIFGSRSKQLVTVQLPRVQ